MSRKSFGSKAWALPQPVSIIGTYDENGMPNAMNAAWTGQYDASQVILCLSAGHKTTKNILAGKEFTISFGTEKEVAACDYVGMVSGNQVADKVSKAGWTAVKADHVNAPVFEQLPMALECRYHGQTENGNIIADIVAISCDESMLDEKGQPDLEKMKLITFNPVNNTYMKIEHKAGDAWKEGKKLQ